MDNNKLLNTLLFKTFISHQWGSNLQYYHQILVHSSMSDECHVQMYYNLKSYTFYKLD